MEYLDEYQLEELQPSWCTQLDTVGMQPHAREYLERCMFQYRSEHKLEECTGQLIDHPRGIQFSGSP